MAAFGCYSFFKYKIGCCVMLKDSNMYQQLQNKRAHIHQILCSNDDSCTIESDSPLTLFIVILTHQRVKSLNIIVVCLPCKW